jgi:hypothetical protein
MRRRGAHGASWAAPARVKGESIRSRSQSVEGETPTRRGSTVLPRSAIYGLVPDACRVGEGSESPETVLLVSFLLVVLARDLGGLFSVTFLL